MKVVTTTVLSAASNASANGSALDTNQAINISFQVVTTSTAAGAVKIQASNDNSAAAGYRQPFTPTHWSDIPNATATVVAGVAPMIVLSNVAFQYVRAVFTSSGGGDPDVLITVQANAVGA